MRLADGTRDLVAAEIPQPRPGPAEILIRVYAAGVTPTELLWYPTSHTKAGEKRDGAVPGHEFSGVVADLGADVVDFEIGQEVYGMNDWFSDGAAAEYCLTNSSSIALKPPRISHTEAASVPIGALTAWQGLFDRARLQRGERVLVHGGAGAVGLFAVQLAHNAGAYVTATASARNLAFVSQLGANQAVDYRAARFEDIVGAVDVVFDTVGGETLRRSWGVLTPVGRMVTIASGEEGGADERTRNAFFIVAPSRDQLAKVGTMLEEGALRAVVDAAVPFSMAAAAYRGETPDRKSFGKVVIEVVRPGAAVGAD